MLPQQYTVERAVRDLEILEVSCRNDFLYYLVGYRILDSSEIGGASLFRGARAVVRTQFGPRRGKEI